MQNQAAPSQKSIKKRRSLKRPDKRTAQTSADSKRILPINVESSDLDAIMTRIATGQETNPQQAFVKIYGLALNAIADTLKSSLVSLIQSADKAELPPFLSDLAPFQTPEALSAIAENIAQKIDESKDRIQLSLAQKATLPMQGNYQSFADAVKKSGLISAIDQTNGKQPAKMPLPNHITAERLREICEDIRHYKPSRSPNDTYKIDLSRLPDRMAINFKTAPAKPAENATDAPKNATSSAQTQTPNPDQVESITDDVKNDVEMPENTANNAQNDVEMPENTANNAQNDVEMPENTANNAQNDVESIHETPQVITTLENTLEALPQVVEQALFNAAVAKQTGDANFENAATQSLKQFTVEVAESFDGLSAMMTDFANQLSAAIIESQAYRLPTLSEALQNDPRAAQDQELLDFVSFLESSDDTPDEPELDNDELAAAFGSLLDQLDD